MFPDSFQLLLYNLFLYSIPDSLPDIWYVPFHLYVSGRSETLFCCILQSLHLIWLPYLRQYISHEIDDCKTISFHLEQLLWPHISYIVVTSHPYSFGFYCVSMVFMRFIERADIDIVVTFCFNMSTIVKCMYIRFCDCENISFTTV